MCVADLTNILYIHTFCTYIHTYIHRGSSSRVIELDVIMTVLRRINLVPTVINEPQVKDVGESILISMYVWGWQ